MKQTNGVPKSTKTRVSHKPDPLKMRVKARHIAGVSMRQNAKAEGINRRTVLAIVKESDIQEHCRALRERYFAIGDLAIDAIIAALTEKKDGHLGQRVLEAMGIPQKQEANAPPNMDAPGQQSGYNYIAWGIANILLEGNKTFGIDIGNSEIQKMVEEAHQDEDSKKKVR